MTVLRMARRASLVLGLLLCGAWLLALYLDRTMTDPPQAVRQVLDAGVFVWLLLVFGIEPGPAKPQQDPGPVIVGAAVLIATTLFAAIVLFRSAPDMKVAAAVIALSGAIGAFLLWRFARNHKDEIGEARFGPDGRQL